VADVNGTTFLPGTSIEIVRDVRLSTPPRFALFDFDGTLSLIREGWPEVMIPLLVESLIDATATSESEQDLTALVSGFVAELTGKQTIYQMFRLVEEIERRGGRPEDPQVYKDRFHAKLMERIETRRQQLRKGEVAAEAMLVPGAVAALHELRRRGFELFLASGTDEDFVKEEVELLGLSEFFGERVYGARDDYRSFSKQMVIERILAERDVKGETLLGLGDGYVEIDNIKSAGGTAIAIASDEKGRSGKPDPWKRERLIRVGADVVLPDFSEFATLCRHLWGE